MILVEGLGADADQAALRAAAVADKFRTALSRDYRLGNIRYCGGASLGLVLFPGASDDPEQMIKEADRAMYEAKRQAASGMAPAPARA